MTVTLDLVVAMSMRHPSVMDELGEALRSDLVVANPFLRRVATFADDFLLKKRKLPGDGDWSVWLESLDAGMVRDGSREALGRLFGIDTSGYDPAFFAEHAVADLQRVAAQVARSRLNEMAELEPEALLALADRVAGVRSGALQGLARLSDVDIWAAPQREEARVATGYHGLDQLIGGWGQELAMIFADSGVGKSLWLQNAAANAAVRGKNVLHVTLELGIRPQIQRYYRQIAQANRAEFAHDSAEVKRRLRHWFRLAKGAVYLLEFPAHSLTPDDLKRTVERASRLMDNGRIDVLVLDYLDLLAATKSGKDGAYADLGRATHEVRALCPAFDMAVLTASQAVRRPEKAGRLTVRDMGDSYQKVRGVDILLSLVQTPEEEEVFQGRLGVLKVRDSGGRGQEIPLYINRDLAMIQELANPNTIELMTRLGHLPKQGGGFVGVKA